MNVSTKLHINTFFSFCIVVIVGGILWQSSIELNDSTRKNGLIDELTEGIFELSFLTQNQIRHPRAQVRIQRQLRYHSFFKLTNAIELSTDLERTLIKEIQENHYKLGHLLKSLSNITSYPNQINLGRGEFEEVLEGQIMARLHNMVSIASHLRKISQKQVVQKQQSASTAIVMIVSIVAVLVAINSLIISRAIIVPIQKLQFRIESIQDDNLDVFIDKLRNDEIGKLYSSFKNMIDRLNNSYLSLRNEIADRKLAETVALENETKLRLITNRLPAMIAYIDDCERYQFTNLEYQKFTNLSEKELLGKKLKDVLINDYDYIQDYVKRALSGRNVSFDKSVQFDKKTIFINAQYVPHVQNNKILGFFTLIVDITERKMEEATLMKDSQVLASMAEGVTMIDSNYRVVSTNNAYEKMFGYTRNELIGKSTSDLYSTKGLKNLKRKVVPDLEEKGEWHGELSNIRKDGSKFISMARITALNSDSETFWVLVQEDVTKRKQIEAQLIQSDKLASLGEMATGVAHELNQPLQIIQMNSELLKMGILKEQPKPLFKYLEMINKQVSRSATIIDHLRTFGRDSSIEKIENIEINAIIRNAFILFNKQFENLGIRIELKLMKTSPKIRCNPIQIEQVITNLLINAKDSMTNVSNKVMKIQVSQSEEWVVIELSDTGNGIERYEKDRVFDPFYTTKEVGKGTGLGLSISHSIITDHDGDIIVADTSLNGTTFRITLPNQSG